MNSLRRGLAAGRASVFEDVVGNEVTEVGWGRILPGLVSHGRALDLGQGQHLKSLPPL